MLREASGTVKVMAIEALVQFQYHHYLIHTVAFSPVINARTEGTETVCNGFRWRCDDKPLKTVFGISQVLLSPG